MWLSRQPTISEVHSFSLAHILDTTLVCPVHLCMWCTVLQTVCSVMKQKFININYYIHYKRRRFWVFFKSVNLMIGMAYILRNNINWDAHLQNRVYREPSRCILRSRPCSDKSNKSNLKRKAHITIKMSLYIITMKFLRL